MSVRVLLCSVLLLVACGGDDSRRQWRFALEEIQGSVQDAYAQRFKQRIEAETQGRVEVTVYPYGALGTSAQLTEQVQNGALQLAFASPGHLGSVIPEVQVFLLHFVLPEEAPALREVLSANTTLRKELGQAYRARGLQLLGIIPEGWMVWTGDRALRSPEDFRGFKIRTMTSPLLLEVYRAYGASPTPMPYAEVYSGLQLNMIDGQVNPVFAIQEMSFYEVQDYMTFAKHLQFVSTLVTSPAFYDGLSPALRDTLEAVRRELDGYIFDYQARLNRERLDAIRAAGGTELVHLTEAQRDAFRRSSLPVRKAYLDAAGERGQRILDALLAAEAAAD